MLCRPTSVGEHCCPHKVKVHLCSTEGVLCVDLANGQISHAALPDVHFVTNGFFLADLPEAQCAWHNERCT